MLGRLRATDCDTDSGPPDSYSRAAHYHPAASDCDPPARSHRNSGSWRRVDSKDSYTARHLEQLRIFSEA